MSRILPTGLLVFCTLTNLVAAQSPPTSAPVASAPAEKLAAKKAGDALEVEESLARFEQVLVKRPLHGPAFSGLVKHFAERDRLSDLVTEYEQKARAMPDQPSLRIVLARVYLRAGQSAKAAEIVDKLTLPANAAADEESRWLVFKAEVYQQVGRNDAAEAMLADALGRVKTVSERFKLAEALSDAYLRGGDKTKAAEAFTKLAADFPTSYLHRKRIADSLAQRSLHEPAAAEYRAILKLVADQNDKRCEVLRGLGRSLEELNKRNEAIDTYTEAIGLLSGGHWLLAELNERIVTLYRASGRLADLVAHCRKQIERSPEQTSMRVLLAEVLAATGDKDGAKKTLADAVELFPKDRALSDKRVQLLERLNDADAIAAEYNRIIAQHADDVELYIAYGQFLANHQKLEAARNQWHHVLQSDVTDATLALRLGAMFEPYELFDDAVECFERAIKLAPQRPEGYTALSRLWFYRGKKDKAADALQRMAKANPTDAAAHATLAQAYTGLGMTDAALTAITRACELDDKQVSYQIERSDLLIQSGKMADALKVRRAAMDLIKNPGQLALGIDVLVSMYASSNQLDALRAQEAERIVQKPRDVLSLLLLARAADYDRQFADARRWLNKVVEIEPSHEEARKQLARLLEAVGDVDAAVDAYQKLSDLFPARARQYFQAIADLKLRYNDKAGAVETFDKMVKRSPGNATVMKTVAEQLVRLQEFDRAIALYEQCLKIQPDAPEIRLAYGKALQEAGRLDDALGAFRQAALQRRDRDVAVDAMGRLHETAGQLGRIDELLQELSARVESNPDDALAGRMLAELLIQEFEYNRAVATIDVALRPNPRDADLLLVRGDVLRRLARFDEAAETYRGILRLPNIDRDYVLGEIGKAYVESGRVDQAKTTWRQINNKLYAGSLLRNNGLLDDAVAALREGVRLKPDDFGLQRALVAALQAAGKVDEALEAAKRLLDLEPDNIFNIEQLAKAFLERGNRADAAEVAARLFSAGVVEKKDPSAAGSGGSASGMGGMPLWALSMQSSWSGSGRSDRSNLERAVQFFQENGLRAELEDTLIKQLAAQPDNALLRETAVELFSETFGKPERALALVKELETLKFPLEYQSWLGQCSQRDYMRVRQYQLIGSKPGLRDQRLVVLEPKKIESLNRDELLELAVIRQSQGTTDEAIKLLDRLLTTDPKDVVALSMWIDTLSRAERFKDAEARAKTLVDILSSQHDQNLAQMVERVRRDFVRTLPLPFQVRVSEQLLKDIADKWMLGQNMLGDFTGFVQVMGLFRAKLSLATIYAKTQRLDEAKVIWKSMEPTNAADSDGWTMLAGVAQLYEQNDIAYHYYEKAMNAAKTLAADPLLQRVYGGSVSASWFGGEQVIDSAFNKIVEAFAGQKKLIELYDFLRETDQASKAKRIAEQYKLYDTLKETYAKRVDAAREEFRRGGSQPIHASVPYFGAVCKLAEIYDLTGDWPKAQDTYAAYLADFPDEIGLLTTLGEAAEAQEEYDKAVAWEKKAVTAKEHLQRQTREWSMRSLYMTPEPPQILSAKGSNRWEWNQRWGKNSGWGYGGQQNPLELWPSWMRIARLSLSLENPLAAADAMERAIGAAGTDRKEVGEEILTLIQERHLSEKMLPVLRSLAVQLPTEEKIQLAFGESLDANKKGDVAAEVYRRMLRRGVSDIGTLARVRDKLGTLQPTAAAQSIDTVQTLEALVKSDPKNANNRLRLAKAYYYSLRVDDALAALKEVEKDSPHLEGLHDLLIEIQTIRGDSPALIAALQAKIQRTTDEQAKRATRERLVEEFLATGKKEDALKELPNIADPKDPQSYQRVGMLMHYFGLHDEAIKQFKLASKSQGRGGWNGADIGKVATARAWLLKGSIKTAATKIIEVVKDQSRQQSQYGAMGGMYAAFMQDGENAFAPFVPLFALKPELLEAVRTKLLKAQADDPDDPMATRHVMQLLLSVGRADEADALLEKMATKKAADQSLVSALIDRCIERREYDRAIELCTRWIEQQPKPSLPPGVPAQMAGLLTMMSPRNLMLCKLGDVHWKRGDADKAFECYHRIVDEKVDESRMAYAAICAIRGRVEEARKLLDETLAKQQVKSPSLLQFQAILAVLDNKIPQAFDLLAEAAETGAGQEDNPYMGGGSAAGPELLAAVARRGGLLDRFDAYMRKQIKKNPNDWSNYQKLAGQMMEAGREKDAQAVVELAAQVKSLRTETLQQRIEWSEGYAPAAQLIADYRQLINLTEKKVNPRSSGRQIYYGGSSEQGEASTLRTRLADLLWNDGQQDEAEKVLSERIDLKSAAGQLALGQNFAKLEAFDRAEKCYRKALELEPNNAFARRALAREAYYKGNTTELAGHVRELFLKQNQGAGDDEDNAYQWQWNANNEQAEDGNAVDQLNLWALEVSRDPKTATDKPAGSEDLHLATAVLTGDWPAADAQLSGRLKSTPYDPMVWRLWALLQERRANLPEAAKAWDYCRRLQKTTLPNHIDQLKLVLAGKHIKDAAAGQRQASMAGQAGASMSSRYQRPYRSYGGYYGGYGNVGQTDTRLASIYIKLKDFDKAERLYLFGAGAQPESMLPMLAGMMWQQDAKPRAVELMRLSVVLSDQAAHQVSQYAALLAETGKPDEAVDLLTRMYHGVAESRRGNQFMSMMGGFGGGQEQHQFEDDQEQSCSSALNDILTRNKLLDPTMKKLSAQIVSDPTDARTAKLLLSLSIRNGLWTAARDSLAAWCKARPADMPMKSELLHANLQIGDYDAALAVLADLRKDVKESADQWCMYEAFIRLIQNKIPEAAAAAEPLLTRATPPSEAGQPWQVATLLGAAGTCDKLTTYFESLHAKHRLDDNGRMMLCRLYRKNGRLADAAKLATTEFWRSPTVLNSTSAWYRELAAICATSKQSDQPMTPDAAHAEDAALSTFIHESSAAGIAAFQKIIADHPDNLNARRGLVLAANHANDFETAAQANQALIDWLAPRRRETLYMREEPSLSETVAAYLTQMQNGGTDASAALGMSMSFSSVMQQLLQGDNSQETTKRVNGEPLWQAHHMLQDELLAALGRTDDLTKLLKQQAALGRAQAAAGNDSSGSRGRYSQRYYSRGGWYQQSFNGGQQDEGCFPNDWRAALRRLTMRHRLIGNTIDTAATENRRLPASAWPATAEYLAAAGRMDEARKWRDRAADMNWLRLRAIDAPQVGRENNYWYWQWYGNDSSQEFSTARWALRFSAMPKEMYAGPAATADEFIDEDSQSHSSGGSADQIWRLALTDPVVETKLIELESKVGPGWEQTTTVSQLQDLHDMRKEYGKTLDMIERICEPRQLSRSNLLAAYIYACYTGREYARLEKLLDTMQELGPALESDVSLNRLAVLRLRKQDSQANALEKTLFAKCRDETSSSHRIDPMLLIASNENTRYYRANRYARNYGESSGGVNECPTLTALAGGLGLRLDGRVREEDVTLERIRDTYSNHGLYRDAARIADMQMAAPQPALSPRERADLLRNKADWLTRAGDLDAARAAFKEAESICKSESAKSPADPIIYRQMEYLYNLKAAGPDRKKALDMLLETKRCDPATDPTGLEEAEYLFKLNQPDAAWKKYKVAIAAGAFAGSDYPGQTNDNPSTTTSMYHAGMAASKAGDTKEAAGLLRQALWRDPQHKLAPKAREITHD